MFFMRLMMESWGSFWPTSSAGLRRLARCSSDFFSISVICDHFTFGRAFAKNSTTMSENITCSRLNNAWIGSCWLCPAISLADRARQKSIIYIFMLAWNRPWNFNLMPGMNLHMIKMAPLINGGQDTIWFAFLTDVLVLGWMILALFCYRFVAVVLWFKFPVF